MFRPMGSQPPSVYWRRRLVVFAGFVLLVVLIVLTAHAASSSSGTPAANSATKSKPQRSSGAPASHSTMDSPSTSSSNPASPKGSSSSSSVADVPCTRKDLAVAAVAGKPTYRVGDKPVLQLQVTNTSKQPCVQDLADKQIELRVYNGASRVWGSHDCQTSPGVTNRTLAPSVAVRVAITWSGLTSQPSCNSASPPRRQEVGAGTYTLFALLAGHTGRAAQFTIG